jgi:hypothetical protein
MPDLFGYTIEEGLEKWPPFYYPRCEEINERN